MRLRCREKMARGQHPGMAAGHEQLHILLVYTRILCAVRLACIDCQFNCCLLTQEARGIQCPEQATCMLPLVLRPNHYDDNRK